jgi:valyl-tRNA synthetase
VERGVAVIAGECVDMGYGTSCLKITPAHDEDDYGVDQKHDLEIIDILNPDGTLNEAAENYIGEDRFEARELIIKDLKELDQLVDIEELENKIGYSERTDAIIEPRLSLQWFCQMDKLAKPAHENVMNDNIQFHPAKFKNSYNHWMENIRDWCISRQLWWGQRIPAWYYGDGKDDYVIAKTEEEAIEKARDKSNNPDLSQDDIYQDEDVLDTWFSSWLWPITVFDPEFIRTGEANEELDYYYPTQDLVTAPEIMFFWVARMIISGYEFCGEKPFSNVYYTGIVRDSQRRKMSKSLGNSPDPMDLMDEYGTDGVRVGMLFSSPAGNDLLYEEKLCEQGRNFANKIWNAFRFLSMNKTEGAEYSDTLEIDNDNLVDRWMLSRLHETIDAINNDMEEFRINEALHKIYSLIWDDFCDWYIELIKADEAGTSIPEDRLGRGFNFFEQLMKLLHPFMPFITEEIWQHIRPRKTEEALIVSSWPEFDQSAVSQNDLELFDTIQRMISSIRNIRAEFNLNPKDEIDLLINAKNTQMADALQQNEWIFRKLQSINTFDVAVDMKKPETSASAVIEGTEVFVPLEGLIDLDKERERIQKEIDRLEEFLKSIEGKLNNDGFVNNAPEDVVQKERDKKEDTETDLEKLRGILEELDQ